MAGIGDGRGITLVKRARLNEVLQVSEEAAIAAHHELAVPASSSGQIDFEVYFLVDDTQHLAIGGHILGGGDMMVIDMPTWSGTADMAALSRALSALDRDVPPGTNSRPPLLTVVPLAIPPAAI